MSDEPALASDETTIALAQTLRFRMGDSLIVWSGPAARRGADFSAIAIASLESNQGRPFAGQAEFIGQQLAARVSGAWATLVLRRR